MFRWEFIVIFIVLLAIILIGLKIVINLLNLLVIDCRENMIDIQKVDRPVVWGRDGDCQYNIIEILGNVFEDNGIKEAGNDDWVVYIPCSYNDIDQEIQKVKVTKSDQRIFIIKGADEISGKNTLWINLVKKYGRDKAKTISPVTYLLYDKKDIELFKKEFDPKKLYIMKKNIQRQEGLKISNNLDEIVRGFEDEYVVVQELLQDPYMIAGRKINMRLYLLFVCKGGELNIYVHKEGFMYYTKSSFKKGQIGREVNITTGYIERWIYKVNPLTHTDFRLYLDDLRRPLTGIETELRNDGVILSEYLFNGVYQMLREVVSAFKGIVCVGGSLERYITFQLFGADIAINDKLEPQIIEINKGASMTPFDQRDREVKYQVNKDILKVIKAVPDNDNHDFLLLVD